ncbi:hypothetical protein KI387_011248, partial [Taxus chinensis]
MILGNEMVPDIKVYLEGLDCRPGNNSLTYNSAIRTGANSVLEGMIQVFSSFQDKDQTELLR